MVVIHPVHYLAQRIGEQIQLNVLPERRCHRLWPTPAQITQLAQSDLVLANGANAGLDYTASLPTGLYFRCQGLAIEIEGHTHSHGKEVRILMLE